MPRGRLVRSLPSLLAASLLVVLGLVPACDDPPEVAPEDRQLALGTITSSVCPSLTVDPPAGKTTVIATVFARDGQVAIGVPVTFTTTHGTFDATVVETDGNGQARAQLTVGRPRPVSDTNEVTLTATTDNGLSAERKLPVPGTPVLGVSPTSTRPAVGNEFQMKVNVGFACNIRKIEGTISWDNANVQLLGNCGDPDSTERSYIEYDILNDVDSTGNQSGTRVTCNATADVASGERSLTFTYERIDPIEGDEGEVDVYGVSDSGSYIGFRFKGIRAGAGDFDLPTPLKAWPADYGDDLDEDFYAVDADGKANITDVSIQGTSSSLAAPRRGRY